MFFYFTAQKKKGRYGKPAPAGGVIGYGLFGDD